MQFQRKVHFRRKIIKNKFRTKVEPEPEKVKPANRGFEDKTLRRDTGDIGSVDNATTSFVAKDDIVIPDVQIDQVILI